jgi:serine/threonine protein kinase
MTERTVTFEGKQYTIEQKCEDQELINLLIEKNKLEKKGGYKLGCSSEDSYTVGKEIASGAFNTVYKIGNEKVIRLSELNRLEQHVIQVSEPGFLETYKKKNSSEFTEAERIVLQNHVKTTTEKLIDNTFSGLFLQAYLNSCANICKVYEFGYLSDDENNPKYIYAVLEELKTHDMFDFVDSAKVWRNESNMKICINFIKGVFDAIVCMHEQGYAHLDIKLENVGSTELVSTELVSTELVSTELVKPDKFKLFDFDMSLFFEPNNSEISCNNGTPGYMAPEIIKHGQASIKSDVYSLSILILFVFFSFEARLDDYPFGTNVTLNYKNKATAFEKYIKNKKEKNINDPSIKDATFKRDICNLVSNMSKNELSSRITSLEAKTEFIKISDDFLGIPQPTDAAATKGSELKLPPISLSSSPAQLSPSVSSIPVNLPPLKRGGKSRKIKRNRIQKRSIKRTKSGNFITNYTITKNVKQSYNRRRRRRFKHLLN